MELNLPKGYLSYSAMDLWARDPEEFRARYYLGKPYMSTPYTEFGNVVGEALETRNWSHPVIAPVRGKVPQGTHPEHKIEVEIGGVPILMYLDDFTLQDYSILEYKTGIRDKKGVAPWDRLQVRKHKQLTIYTLGVWKKYGHYNPDINLVWMETKWSTITEVKEFAGAKLEQKYVGLKLTGHVEVFPRTIQEWELLRVEESIRKIAEDISNDYTTWKKLN